MIHLLAALALQVPAPAPYWQQHVTYLIDARLDEPTATLGGHERVTYTNHSPDVLHTIAFHLYLNAFRPGSRWSEADAAERRHRFDKLKDPDFAFNHVRNVTIDGTVVSAVYPLAPDSTIVRFTLPHALAPGDSIDVMMDWDARPSTVPRRQGRRGRSYDFAQWYPKVVVYDTYGWEEHALYPAGEFYGEFGDFYVKLDVPQDQVVGATGALVCGDPGWQRANQGPDSVKLDPVPGQRRDIVEQIRLPDGSSDCVLMPVAHRMDAINPPDSGRKQLIWMARDVHNFAITMSPDYRYEGGEWNGIQVHVLYQPGDEKTWGGSIVVNNTITMLKWMNFIFGKYPWPQMTVAHRIEGGGTEFPMMEMNGSPSLGLNLHEGGHTYLMGILANNEWREGWMDEGFTSFQTTWYEELQARNDGATRNLEYDMLRSDLDGESEPVSTVSEKFRDFNTYDAMIYNRGELFLSELKRIVGDSVMLEILHRYYARWQLHHVNEAAFKAVVEEVTHRDMTTFFAQWLHDVALTDYAVGAPRRERTDSGWTTTVPVHRLAAGIYPVTVAVFAEHDTAYATVDGVAPLSVAIITTKSRPRAVMLDPREVSHDWNMLNNRYSFSLLQRVLAPVPTDLTIGHPFSPRLSRSRVSLDLIPTVWYNDIGGLTLGVRSSSNYLDRFEQNTNVEACSTGASSTKALEDKACSFMISLRNPVWWRAADTYQHLTAFRVEGRAGAGISVDKETAPHAGFGPHYTEGVALNWTATYNMAYLPPLLWDNGGTVEAALWGGVTDTRHGWTLSANFRATGGVMYARPGGGFTTEQRYDAQPYSRPQLTLGATRSLGARTTFGIRGYAGAVIAHDEVLTQRRIYVSGADPYQLIDQPLIRSVGSPLLRTDCWCQWHTPGDGNLRGYTQALSTNRLVAFNSELTRAVLTTKRSFLNRISVALFGDAGYAGNDRGIGGDGSATPLMASNRFLADGGVGFRFGQRIGSTSWTTRVDIPFYVSDPAYAFAQRTRRVALDRLLVSFSPVIR